MRKTLFIALMASLFLGGLLVAMPGASAMVYYHGQSRGEVNYVLPTSAAGTAENKLVNPSFEQAGESRTEAYGWQPFHNGYKRLRVSHSGRWGIKLRNTDFSQLSGAYQRVDLNQTEVKPVFIGAYVKGWRVEKEPGSYFGASLYAEIHLADGEVIKYWNTIANEGTFGWRWIGFNTQTITLDGANKFIDQPIDYIFVVPILGHAKGTAFFDDLTVMEFTPTTGAVTLMFDDGEITTYTEAKPVLDEYGYVGSASIITEMVEEPDFMDWEQLNELEDSGWEIVSHSITHPDLTTVSPAQLSRELVLSKMILERHGLKVDNFALPFGAYDANILARAALHYSSVRAYELGDNPVGSYPFEIKVRSVTNSTTVDDVNQWLAKAQARGSWQVIVFHTIADSSDDAYYVTPENFQAMIAAVAASGLPVITYRQGIESFCVQVK